MRSQGNEKDAKKKEKTEREREGGGHLESKVNKTPKERAATQK